MNDATRQAQIDELPPELQKIVNDMDRENLSSHGRLSVALLMVVRRAIDMKLPDEQFVDLYLAGMKAHRIASVETFFSEVIFGERGTEQLKKAGGISSSALAAIALTHLDEVEKQTEQFMTLCEMLED